MEMTMSVEHHSSESALAGDTKQSIGQYRLEIGTGAWWWSPQTYRIHGFEPGEVVPTTDLVLAHKHPEDRDRFRAVLDQAVKSGEPFSSTHRIMDARGKERCLVVVGQGRRDRDSGELVELLGYFVDVTRAVAARAQERAQRDIEAAAQNRGAIEQAKGMVAVTCGVCPDEAFGLLRRASNDRNVPLRELAHQVVAAAGGEDGGGAVTTFLGPLVADRSAADHHGR
jgi:hypothetical protein